MESPSNLNVVAAIGRSMKYHRCSICRTGPDTTCKHVPDTDTLKRLSVERKAADASVTRGGKRATPTINEAGESLGRKFDKGQGPLPAENWRDYAPTEVKQLLSWSATPHGDN